MFDSQNHVELSQSVSDANCYKAGTVPGMMRITLSYDCDSTLASFSRINLDQSERRKDAKKTSSSNRQ
jgi:hypothetical protein